MNTTTQISFRSLAVELESSEEKLAASRRKLAETKARLALQMLAPTTMSARAGFNGAEQFVARKPSVSSVVSELVFRSIADLG